jgi:cytochrome c biogenesis protein CcmG/thiol:disulfide interchange protein DsbE
MSAWKSQRLNADVATAGKPRVHRVRLMLPVVILGALIIFLDIGPTRDPRVIRSPLIGKPVPVFDLPPVEGRLHGLSNRDFGGDVVLLNVFASWCMSCRAEHPLLLALSRQHAVPIFGLTYKDKPDDAAAWLDKMGDPYALTGADLDGRVGVDWSVDGVPETFVIDRAGRVAYRHSGPLTPAMIKNTLLPLIENLRR